MKRDRLLQATSQQTEQRTATVTDHGISFKISMYDQAKRKPSFHSFVKKEQAICKKGANHGVTIIARIQLLKILSCSFKSIGYFHDSPNVSFGNRSAFSFPTKMMVTSH